MKELAQQLVRRGTLELIVAVGLGYALVGVARATADVVTGILAQHVRDPDRDSIFGRVQLFESGAYVLNFDVGGTVIVYGGALAALVVLTLVSFVALAVLRVRARDLVKCPHCRSDVPHDARVCRFCLLELPPPA